MKTDYRHTLLADGAARFDRPTPSVFERAEFVREYRVIWEAEQGAIKRGGDRLSAAFAARNAGQEKSFLADVQFRLGVSQASAKRLQRIALGLEPSMREALRGSSMANNQAVLLKLATVDRSKQLAAAKAVRGDEDLQQAVSLLVRVAPLPKP